MAALRNAGSCRRGASLQSTNARSGFRVLALHTRRKKSYKLTCAKQQHVGRPAIVAKRPLVSTAKRCGCINSYITASQPWLTCVQTVFRRGEHYISEHDSKRQTYKWQVPALVAHSITPRSPGRSYRCVAYLCRCLARTYVGVTVSR